MSQQQQALKLSAVEMLLDVETDTLAPELRIFWEAFLRDYRDTLPDDGATTGFVMRLFVAKLVGEKLLEKAANTDGTNYWTIPLSAVKNCITGWKETLFISASGKITWSEAQQADVLNAVDKLIESYNRWFEHEPAGRGSFILMYLALAKVDNGNPIEGHLIRSRTIRNLLAREYVFLSKTRRH